MDYHYGDLLWNSYAPESLLILTTLIVLNLLTLLGLGMFIEKEPFKRYMVNHFLILGICSVFGIIETSGQRP